MEFNQDTRLKDIVDQYPWLPEAVSKMDPRLKIVNTPIGRALISRATLGDASRRSGFPLETLLVELRKVIAEHEGKEQG